METEFATGAGRLGLAEDSVRELVELRHDGACAPVQRRMAELVGARLAGVEAQLRDLFAEQAAAGGVGTADVQPIARSLPLAQGAGQLQAAARILAGPPAAGGCSDACACSRAAAATSGAWAFPGATAAPDGPPLVCTLDAGGGDLAWPARRAPRRSRPVRRRSRAAARSPGCSPRSPVRPAVPSRS